MQLGPMMTLPVPGAGKGPLLPEHCDVVAVLRERTSPGGDHYAIHFHARLPTAWNGRFLFQGGAGSNGATGDALGETNEYDPPAIALGFAVVSQDSGHDNRSNANPARLGTLAFGFDPQARADYGYASLPLVADAAKALIKVYYSQGAPKYSYFFGCDKGGQEALVFASRYPDRFNGILAGAPGLSAPKAALAQVWDTQTLAPLARASFHLDIPVNRLGATFSDADLALVRDAVLNACDADDGLRDGIVGDFTQCTTAKVQPALHAKICGGDKGAGCLSAEQVQALERMQAGPVDAAGRALYVSFPWDAGINGGGWRAWKLGSVDGRSAPLNVMLGAAALAALYTTPPTPMSVDPQQLFDWQRGFDLGRGGARIFATDAQFLRSAWDDIAVRPADLSPFQANGGKLLVFHGVSDPVISINDTLGWYQALARSGDGKAADYVRLFAVPGMGHCSGGPATDSFGAFEALINWVEHGRAPDRMIAVAGPNSPWPRRSRPLCAFPKSAHYDGHGPAESASSFVCR
jgi:feruloyl esterase